MRTIRNWNELSVDVKKVKNVESFKKEIVDEFNYQAKRERKF